MVNKIKAEQKPTNAKHVANVDADRDVFTVYCHLLHGWHKQPENFETFAERCISNARRAVELAKDRGIL